MKSEYEKINILSAEYNVDPYLFIERLNRKSKVIYDNSINSKIVICYDTVKQILSRHEIFSTEPLAMRAEPVMRGRVLAQMNGKEHRFKKSLITKQITGKTLEDNYKKKLTDICDEIIPTLLNKHQIDIVQDFGKIFSISSTLKMLGIKKDNLIFFQERLQLIVKFATGFNLNDTEKKHYISAACEMERVILTIIEERKKNPENDLLSSLIINKDHSNKRELSDSEIVALTLNLLLAASEPVDKVISLSIYHLFRHPEYLKDLQENKISTNDVLQETLRLTPPVHLIPRLTMENYTTESGCKFVKGEIVYLQLAAANRDPVYFKSPHSFIPDREFKSHLSYGSGIHTCVGAQFANMQLNLAIDKLLPLLLNYEESSPPSFDGIYTRGATSYIIKKRRNNE